MEQRGRFIVIEGLDGCGKSSHVRTLSKRLKSEGRLVYPTAEPTDSALGGLLRDALAGNPRRCPEEMAALFLADRIEHNQNPVKGFERHLQAGADVVCDRYYYSSMAYQGMDSDLGWIMRMNLDCAAIRRPDLCIFLDLEPESCDAYLRRGRLRHDIFEGDIEMIRRIRESFFRVFELLGGRETIVRIDAARTHEEVAEDVYRAVSALQI